MLDVQHNKPVSLEQATSDRNTYSWGRVGVHNIVLTLLPSGEQGKAAAAAVATNLQASLPHVRIGLFVGLGAGIPRYKTDVS